MDASQLAETAREQLSLAYELTKPALLAAFAKISGATELLEPLTARVLVLQVQLHDYVVRLAAVPWLRELLEGISEIGAVQDVTHVALGQRKLAPDAWREGFRSLIALRSRCYGSSCSS